MTVAMKKALRKAISDVIERYADGRHWDGWIHPTLEAQMTDAAANVFDATMDVQKWLTKEGHLK